MNWDTSPARTYYTTVTVEGVVRPHEPDGITWAQDITSDLPDTVTAGGQASHRTGTIVWKAEGVTTRAPSPWYASRAWIPSVGSAVTIDVTDGSGNTYRVFTGVIDTAEGDAHGRWKSNVVSAITGGNRVVRRQAQTQVGGLVAENTVGRFATTPVWLVSEINRELGYHSVPPAPAASKVILDAPLQGSTYNYSTAPNANAQVVVSHRAGFPALHPVWSSGRDGFGISNALVEWTPRTGGGSGAGAVGVSLLMYAGHSEDALVTIAHGGEVTYVRARADKTIRVSTYVNQVMTTQDIAIPAPTGDGPHRVSVVCRGGQVHVRIGETMAQVPAPTPAAAISRITLDAGPGSCVAGLQVWHPSSLTDHHATGWAPTAFYRYGTGTQSTTLTPSVRDEKAKEVLNDYAGALLSPVWVDHNGNLQIVTGKALHEQTPALTVDALRDVSELSYSMALLDYRPTVEVTYAHAHQTNTGATNYKTTVWQGSGGTVAPDAPDQTFVEVPDDEEWIGLSDPAAARHLRTLVWEEPDFIAGEGSWWGYNREDTAGTEFMTTNVSQVVETLTPWVWKVTSSTTEIDGATATTPSHYSATPRRFRGFDLPVYRARSLVRYEDRTVAVATDGVTELDGVLAHDAGKWITTTAAATSLAAWIHTMVGNPTPVLDGLKVRFDPRIDVGVKLTVNATGVFGVNFQVLVLSVDHDPGSDTTTVLARVTLVTAYRDTLDDVDHAHLGQTLAYWDQARAGRTLDSVAAAPYI